MAWDHLSINKPHLVYIILGGFTTLFMLCSSFIKEQLYIGEATVATICGIIFGPHAANLIDPSTWGNVDQITLEFSRIVLVVQCFAVGVELPKYYMEKHWKSVTLLLLPVMTFGWLITSLVIWWMVPTLNWIESLVVASCVTATDPVLASSVVGKGKFAKRVPKHLRDLLSAESGCNDGMAFPFVYLALYIIHYGSKPKDVAFHWIVISVLYECIFGAIFGFIIGYIGRRGIRWAEKKELIDRESFLVFYFVLALFCAGSGSILGMDDLLVGFAAGVGFSNDGWFTQKTEESHVSNVIDLLINLAYFVYFGTIVPWEQFNSPELGTAAWRLVIIAIFVLLFRRIPIMLALKPIISDIKSWREALFAGHFGPIGVGAIFIAILARAELETGTTTPLAELPPESAPHYHLIALIWPITTFLVITSIIVHGSSIAVFTLGKHINTLSLTMSYTQGPQEGEGATWMNRLPRISSTSKSMSKTQDNDYDSLQMADLQPGVVPPAFLRRQKEEDEEGGRSSGLLPLPGSGRRRKSRDRSRARRYEGGPVETSAISPLPRRGEGMATSETLIPDLERDSKDSEELDKDGEAKLGEIQHDAEMEEIMHHGDQVHSRVDKHISDAEAHPGEAEAYKEGDMVVLENEDGEVIATSPPEQSADPKGKLKNVAEDIEHPEKSYRNLRKRLGVWMRKDNEMGERQAHDPNAKMRGPAQAFQFGNTVIIENEDGDVIKKYELPRPAGEPGPSKPIMTRLGSYMGRSSPAAGSSADAAAAGTSRPAMTKKDSKLVAGLNKWSGLNAIKTLATSDSTGLDDPADDQAVRFTLNGQRMTKDAFVQEMKRMTPKERQRVVETSDAPAAVKEAARKDADPSIPGSGRLMGADVLTEPAPASRLRNEISEEDEENSPVSSMTLTERERKEERVDAEGSDERRGAKAPGVAPGTGSGGAEVETEVERRRRLGALGHSVEEDEGPGEAIGRVGSAASASAVRGRGIRFAEPVRGAKR